MLEKSFFLINFIGVIFEAGNETFENIWSGFGAEQKLRAERNESGFVHTAVFERARNSVNSDFNANLEGFDQFCWFLDEI